MEENEIIDKIESLREEYLKNYIPDMKYIMQNGSANEFYETIQINNFDDMINFLVDCSERKYDINKNKHLESFKNYKCIESDFDVTAFYELVQMERLLILFNSFKNDFNSGLIDFLSENNLRYDDIPKKYYHNKLMKFIEGKYLVVESNTFHILLLKHEYIKTNRHIFTMLIDKRIIELMKIYGDDILQRKGFSDFGQSGPIYGFDEILRFFAASGLMKEWIY